MHLLANLPNGGRVQECVAKVHLQQSQRTGQARPGPPFSSSLLPASLKGVARCSILLWQGRGRAEFPAFPQPPSVFLCLFKGSLCFPHSQDLLAFSFGVGWLTAFLFYVYWVYCLCYVCTHVYLVPKKVRRGHQTPLEVELQVPCGC